MADNIQASQWPIIHEVMMKTWQVLNGAVPMPPSFPQEVIDNFSDNIRILYFDLLRLYDVAVGVQGRQGEPGVQGEPGPRTVYGIANQKEAGLTLSSEIDGEIKVSELGIMMLNGWQTTQRRLLDLEVYANAMTEWINSGQIGEPPVLPTRTTKYLLASEDVGLLAKENVILMAKKIL